jgi:integrase/recombinase XerC
MALTGPFRPVIEEYLKDNTYYRKGTLPSVKMSLLHFFTFVAQDLKLTRLEDVSPRVVTKFMVHEQDRGLRGRNFIGHLSTFFEQLIAEERVEMKNPVRSRIHSQKGSPANPRPYTDQQIGQLWQTVDASGDLGLMLAFWIGRECGMRIGEVCNIRLSDVDAEAQTIEVRLPTKNGSPRTVRFHDKVTEYLPVWLTQRDPECGHDHLLHTQHSSRTHFTSQTLCAWFRKFMRTQPEPVGSFVFHRLRHSWATSLLNAGIDLVTLKELGGWKSWTSLERYTRVLPETIRRQYEQAYAKIQERQERAVEDEPISLLQFAEMNAA